MNMNSDTLCRLIGKADRIAVCGHVNPDGDAVGSTLAFALGLEQLGKEATVLLPGRIDPILGFMKGADRIITPEDEWEDVFDLLVCLDCSDASRLGAMGGLMDGRPCVIIDHHVTTSGTADWMLVEPQAAATGEILTDLLPEIGVTIDRDIATCLLVAIEMDTGGLAFKNTSPRTLRAAAMLVERGADISSVHERLYASRRLGKTRLMARALEHIKSICDDAVLTTVLYRKDFEESGATEVDSDGIINYLKEVDTCRICAMIRETQTGCKVSFRCVPGYDVANVAAAFGGGGHVLAAGCSLEVSPDEAETMLLEKLAQTYREGK